MSDLVLALLWVLLGAAVGCGATVLALRSRRPVVTDEPASRGLRPGAEDVIQVLKSMTVVLDGSDRVLQATPSAHGLGLVRAQGVAHEQLRDLVREVRRDQEVREVELELPRSLMGPGRVLLVVRVAALPNDIVLMLIEDGSHMRRVEETRRDFVVNVSHELKTPVGGLRLLAEAVEDARDDPEGVRRFARRMQVEAERLSKLVQEIVELSRLQVADTLHEPALVDVNGCVADAIDYVRVLADDRAIDVRPALAQEAPQVYGDAELLTTAVRNLVSNAVNYSNARTRVAVTVRLRSEVVEIVVSDQGLGIPQAEQERIFERFYRVDAARSRATGGTGLGLAIVKHVCLNHGGEVNVWSEEGLGSTFTMRLPLADHDQVEQQPPPGHLISPIPRKEDS